MGILLFILLILVLCHLMLWRVDETQFYVNESFWFINVEDISIKIMKPN